MLIEARSASSMQAPRPERSALPLAARSRRWNATSRLRSVSCVRAPPPRAMSSTAICIFASIAGVAFTAASAAVSGSTMRRTAKSSRRNTGFGTTRWREPQNVGVEEIPVMRLAHERAELRPRADEALGGEHLQRFAQAGAADAELGEQRHLVRQRPCRRIVAAEDAKRQRLGDPALSARNACERLLHKTAALVSTLPIHRINRGKSHHPQSRQRGMRCRREARFGKAFPHD